MDEQMEEKTVVSLYLLLGRPLGNKFEHLWADMHLFFPPVLVFHFGLLAFCFVFANIVCFCHICFFCMQ
jgi:hypothetical protein